jgi:hypothetical protein
MNEVFYGQISFFIVLVLTFSLTLLALMTGIVERMIIAQRRKSIILPSWTAKKMRSG